DPVLVTQRKIAELAHATGLKVALLACLAFVLAVLWIGLLLHLSSQRRLELDHATQSTDNLTRVYAEQIAGNLRGIDQTLLLLKQVHELHVAGFNPSFTFSSGVLLKGADLRVRVVGAGGFTIYSTDAPTFVGNQDYFRVHAARDDRGLFIGTPAETELE